MKLNEDIRKIKFLLKLPMISILESKELFNKSGNKSYRANFNLAYTEVSSVQSFLKKFESYKMKEGSSELLIIESDYKYFGVKCSDLYENSISVHVYPKIGFKLKDFNQPDLKEESRGIIARIIKYMEKHSEI